MDKFHYKILEEIGKGSFGRVYKARKVRSDYAIKKVRCDAPENVELALQEFWTLSCLKAHNNIIRFEECYLQHGSEIRPMKHGDKSSPSYMYLVEMAIKGKRGWDQAQYYLWFVMEYCNCGDMNDYILDRDPIPYLNTIFMVQLADGISFLHRSNVVHRDLKPENVLVRSLKGRDPVLKIADFGLSKVCNHPIKDADQGEDDCINVDTCWLSSACGSDFFMAPEVFEGRYTAKADVFALGIMFWAIMDRITFIDAGTKKVLLGTYVRRNKEVLPVGEALLDDPNLDMTQLLVDTGQGPAPGQRSKRSHTRSCVAGNKKKLRNLIAQMVHPNPEFRPSSQELLGRLGSILQHNERPKGLRWNIKKPNVAKSDFNLPGMVDVSANQDDLSDQNKAICNLDSAIQEADNHFGVRVKKDNEFRQNKDVVVDSQQSLTNRRRRKPRQCNIPSHSNRSAIVEEMKSESEETVASVAKARRRVLAAVKKRQLERSVTRNLRSVANVRKLAEGAKDIVKYAQKTDSTQFCPSFSTQSVSEERDDGVKPQSPSKGEKHDLCEFAKSARESSNFEGFSKIKDENITSSGRQVESDDGFLLDTDADSRDSSIASEIPEFDSGYKSKRSRRISNVADQVEDNLIKNGTEPDHSNDKTAGVAVKKLPISSISKEDKICVEENLSSNVPYRTEDKVNKSPLYYRRHNGLKEQIRACKANADIEHRQKTCGSKYLCDQVASQSIVSITDKNIAPKTPVLPAKPKLEVPRTPCLVMQSKAKIRHNPFQTAVKKRWKYVVLDEYPSPSPPNMSSSTTRESGERRREDGTSVISNPKISKEELNPTKSIQSSVMTETKQENLCKLDRRSRPDATTRSPAQEFPRTSGENLSKKHTFQQQNVPHSTIIHGQLKRPIGSDTTLQASTVDRCHSDLDSSMNNYMNTSEVEKLDKVPFGDGKKLFENSLAHLKQQHGCKSAEDELHSAILQLNKQSNNDEYHSSCCKVNPRQFDSEMLQRLSSYWYPGKGVHANGHKAFQAPGRNRGPDLHRSRHPTNHSDLISSHIDYAAAQGTSGVGAQFKNLGVNAQLKVNAGAPSIPIIDLTQDGDCVPFCKKARYEDDGYSSAHKNTGLVVHPRRFHSTSLDRRGSKHSQRWRQVRENSVGYMSTCNSINRRHVKANVSGDLSPQRYKMQSHSRRHQDTFHPRATPNSARLTDTQLEFQQTLQISPSTPVLHNSLHPPLACSSISYLPFRQEKRGFGSPSQSCFDQRNISALTFPPYGGVESESDRRRQRSTTKLQSDLRSTSTFTGRYVQQPRLLGSDQSQAMSSLAQIEGVHRMRNLYSPPPLIRRPVPGLMTPYDNDNSPNANFCSVESNILTLTSYPCRLQHSKPILNN